MPRTQLGAMRANGSFIQLRSFAIALLNDGFVQAPPPMRDPMMVDAGCTKGQSVGMFAAVRFTLVFVRPVVREPVSYDSQSRRLPPRALEYAVAWLLGGCYRLFRLHSGWLSH